MFPVDLIEEFANMGMAIANVHRNPSKSGRAATSTPWRCRSSQMSGIDI
jgi:hypothetical protein